MADESRSSHTSDSDSESESESKPNLQPTAASGNAFKNDGSFMEMFKKMQDERNKQDSSYFGNPASSGSKEPLPPDSVVKEEKDESQESSTQAQKKSSIMSFVGKRRGGRVLPTGIVKKPRKPDQAQEEGEPNDAWSRYLSEVRKYREQSCEEEGKRRPLVK